MIEAEEEVKEEMVMVVDEKAVHMLRLFKGTSQPEAECYRPRWRHKPFYNLHVFIGLETNTCPPCRGVACCKVDGGTNRCLYDKIERMLSPSQWNFSTRGKECAQMAT